MRRLEIKLQMKTRYYGQMKMGYGIIVYNIYTYIHTHGRISSRYRR